MTVSNDPHHPQPASADSNDNNNDNNNLHGTSSSSSSQGPSLASSASVAFNNNNSNNINSAHSVVVVGSGGDNSGGAFKRPVLIFGKRPSRLSGPQTHEQARLAEETEDAKEANDNIFRLVKDDQAQNIVRVRQFYQRSQPPNGESNRSLRHAIYLDETSPEVVDLFINDRTTYAKIAIENAWGDLTLHDIQWTPLHIAAFLNQVALVEVILQLDAYRFTLDHLAQSRVIKLERDRLGLTCVPDSQGRLPIDILYWKKETLRYHAQKGNVLSKRELAEHAMVFPEMIAKLTPAGEVTRHQVEENIQAPLDAAWGQINSFIIFQALIIIETLVNTSSLAVRLMCAGFLVFVMVLGYTLYAQFRAYGSSSLMPVYYFYSRVLLAVILYFKTFYAFEAVDSSQVFLGYIFSFALPTCNTS